MKKILFIFLLAFSFSMSLMTSIEAGYWESARDSHHDPVSDKINRCIKKGDTKSLQALAIPQDYRIDSNLLKWIDEIVNKKKDEELLSVLLDKVSVRVDLKKYFSNKRSLWHALLHNGNEWAIKYFIKNYDLDPNVSYYPEGKIQSIFPLEKAFNEHLNVSLIKVLLDNGAQASGVALYDVVSNQDLDGVKLLLSYGADPNVPWDEYNSSSDETPLKCAKFWMEAKCGDSNRYYYKDNNNPDEKSCKVATQIVEELKKRERLSQKIIKKVAKAINSF